jgi:uncharacterized lipoprotein YddW (UPF0748 family)
MQNYDVRTEKMWLKNLCDSIADAGFNTVIFQVKPMGDALYPSEFSPWSSVLTGKTGLAPDNFFDPLHFFIEAAHEHDLEVHAWFNPFRLGKFTWRNDICVQKFPLGHFFEYKEQFWLDPGHPDSRNFASKNIAEVLMRYDIDGVHLDDYFYPYRDEQEDVPDDVVFQVFGGLFKDKAAWRRQNVTDFVRRVHSEIKKAKPYIKFGVSPFGIWQNAAESPEGSQTKSRFSAYSHVYADAKLWLEKKIVDYVCPQIYFSTKWSDAPFETVLAWWNRLENERHVYAGIGIYRINEEQEDKTWLDSTEMQRQHEILKKYKNIKGKAYFRWRNWQENKLNFRQFLAEDWSIKALPPTMEWLVFPAPPVPFQPSFVKKGKEIVLSWAIPPHECGKIRYFLRVKKIYRSGKTEEEIIYSKNNYFIFFKKDDLSEIQFSVCSKNRIAVLSDFSEVLIVK